MRGYNNNEYYYDHRKSAAAMAYLAAAAPTPLHYTLLNAHSVEPLRIRTIPIHFQK